MIKKASHLFICIFVLLMTNVVADENAIPESDVMFYMKDNDVDEYRLSTQDGVGELNAILMNSEGDLFSGLYIQDKPEYLVYVLYKKQSDKTKEKKFLDKLESTIEKEKWKDIIRVRQVEYSYDELRELQYELTFKLRRFGLVVASAIDVENNLVDIYLDNSSVDLFNAKKISLPKNVRVTVTRPISSNRATIYGGDGFDSSPGCTMGLSVKDSNGVKGIATVGHCRDT